MGAIEAVCTELSLKRLSTAATEECEPICVPLPRIGVYTEEGHESELLLYDCIGAGLKCESEYERSLIDGGIGRKAFGVVLDVLERSGFLGQ